MENRFLVRYWVKGSKKYLNSNKLVYNDGTYTQVSTKQLPDGKYISYILYEWDTFEVIPEQCTGLKDKNGKLIYEGDIVKRSGQAFIVEWRQDRLSFVLSNYKNLLESYDITHFDWEIIGNIHKNTDLLEQEDVAED